MLLSPVLHPPALQLLGRPGRQAVAWATLANLAATLVLFALPLSRATTDVVSNVSFMVMIALAAGAAVAAMRNTSGHQHEAWRLILLAFVTTTVLFGLDPQPADGDRLSIALDVGFLPALAMAGGVIAMCRPVFPAFGSLRTVADAVWVVATLLAVMWEPVVEPALGPPGHPVPESALHLGFVCSCLLLSVVAAVALPQTAGHGRLVLALLAAGGVIISIAGLLHIRFFHEQTLAFGTPADSLWLIGLTLLILAGLLADDATLRFRRRSVRWHAAFTIVPLLAAIPALLQLDLAHEMALVLGLLVAFCLRTLALLFENDRLTSALSADANNDPLTGLGNRRGLLDAVAAAGETARRRHRLRGVIVVDLDHFKAINDTHGHLVGDRVLEIVGHRLRSAVRADAVLVRYGGDEFVIVLPVRQPGDAVTAANRVRDAVHGTYGIDDLSLELDAAIGIALDTGELEPAELLAVADGALYEAKASGRGRVVLHQLTDA